MTQHPIKVLADGTHVYSNGTRYKPKAPSERVYKVRKPAVKGAVYWAGAWHLPLDLLPVEARVLPETVPDDEVHDHSAKPKQCKCYVCKRRLAP